MKGSGKDEGHAKAAACDVSGIGDGIDISQCPIFDGRGSEECQGQEGSDYES